MRNSIKKAKSNKPSILYRPFVAKDFFRIPDGTLLSPFLNSKDSNSKLPFDLTEGFSIAFGIIEEKSSSSIHVHPHVDQATFVLSGEITLKIKGIVDQQPYTINLKENQAGISIGGDFFQLINSSNKDCHVLYIVSPAYLFLKEGDDLLFDDSIILPQNWEELANINWKPSQLYAKEHSLKARKIAYKKLKKRSQ